MSDFTEKAIKNAFIKLLSERPFPSVKVKDVVRECGINRNSFYYHFRDLSSLFEEIIRDECENAVRCAPAPVSLKDAYLRLLGVFYSYRASILNVFRSGDRAAFEHYTRRALRFARETANAENDEKTYIYETLALGHIILWLHSGAVSDPRVKFSEMCEHII